MNFSSVFQPRILIFGMTLCGYGCISFLVSNPSLSQLVTLPYRGVILVVSIFLLLSNLNIIYPRRRNLAEKIESNFFKKFIFIVLFLFLLFYSFRLIYDVLIRSDSVLFMEDRSLYIIIWFLFTLIPGLNFLFLDSSKSENYLLITWLFYCSIGTLAILMSPDQADQFFSEKGRLAGAALNPISLGGYGSSLAELSLFIWLRHKYLLKILINKTRSFIYLITLSIGISVLIQAASRGPMIEFAILLPIIIFTSNKVDHRTLFIVLFTTIAISGAAIYGLEHGSLFIDRMFMAGDEFDPTGQGRGNILEIAIKDIAENPLIGVGIEMRDGGFPHNIIVESFLPVGLIGGAMFTLIFCHAFVKSFKMLTDLNNKWGWLGLMYIHQAIIAMSSGCMYSSSEFWYLLFAVVSINCESPPTWSLTEIQKTNEEK
jgi:hypothetical protein